MIMELIELPLGGRNTLFHLQRERYLVCLLWFNIHIHFFLFFMTHKQTFLHDFQCLTHFPIQCFRLFACDEV